MISQDQLQTNLTEHYLRFYADQYSKISNSISPVTALSHLEQNCKLLESEHQECFFQLRKKVEQLLTDSASNSMHRLFPMVSSQLFLKSGFPITAEVDKTTFDKFIDLMRPYLRGNLKDTYTLSELFDYFIRERILYAQLITSAQIIQYVLNHGYPNEITLSQKDVDKATEKVTKSKKGRNPEIPSGIVKDILIDALQKAQEEKPSYTKFIKKNDSPNIRQLAIYLSEKGYGTELELRSLQRTVKRVLKEYDIIKSVMT